MKKPHVLMVSIPAHSHIYPMLELGLKLAAAGCVVSFVSPERTHSHIMKLGRERLGGFIYEEDRDSSRPLIRSSFSMIRVEDGLPIYTKNDRPSAAAFADAIARIEGAVAGILSAQMATRRREEGEDDDDDGQPPPVSCLISNFFLFGMQAVATAFGLPKIDFFPCAAAALSINIFMVSLKTKLQLSPPQDKSIVKGEEELIIGIPGLPPLKRSDIAKDLWMNDITDAMSQIISRPFEHIKESKLIIVNTVYELERDVIDALRSLNFPICPMGPLLPNQSSSIKDNGCLNWLNTQKRKSVVYVSFGTFVNLSIDEIKQLAIGLENSKCAFLWVIQSKDNLDLASVLPVGFQERTKERGKLVSWAPQVSILQHVAIGVFISHCGWNSTIESVAAGVPIIGWPIEQEQATNLRLIIEQWQVGVPLQGAPNLQSGHIEFAINVAMESTFLHERASSLAKVVSTATTSSNSSSILSFKQLINYLHVYATCDNHY